MDARAVATVRAVEVLSVDKNNGAPKITRNATSSTLGPPKEISLDQISISVVVFTFFILFIATIVDLVGKCCCYGRSFS